MFTQLIRFNEEELPTKVQEMAQNGIFHAEKGLIGFTFLNNEDIGEYGIVVLWDSEEAAVAALESIPESQLVPVA